MFAAKSKRCPAGDQHLQLRATSGELGDQGGCRSNVFEVVQQQQHGPIVQREHQRLFDGQCAGLGETQSVCDGGRDQVGIGQCVQRNPEDAAGGSGSRSEATSRASRVLPTPPGPVRVNTLDIRAAQQSGHRRNVPLPPDQRAGRHRKTARMATDPAGAPRGRAAATRSR